MQEEEQRDQRCLEAPAPHRTGGSEDERRPARLDTLSALTHPPRLVLSRPTRAPCKAAALSARRCAPPATPTDSILLARNATPDRSPIDHGSAISPWSRSIAPCPTFGSPETLSWMISAPS